MKIKLWAFMTDTDNGMSVSLHLDQDDAEEAGMDWLGTYFSDDTWEPYSHLTFLEAHEKAYEANVFDDHGDNYQIEEVEVEIPDDVLRKRLNADELNAAIPLAAL